MKFECSVVIEILSRFDTEGPTCVESSHPPQHPSTSSISAALTPSLKLNPSCAFFFHPSPSSYLTYGFASSVSLQASHSSHCCSPVRLITHLIGSWLSGLVQIPIMNELFMSFQCLVCTLIVNVTMWRIWCATFFRALREHKSKWGTVSFVQRPFLYLWVNYLGLCHLLMTGDGSSKIPLWSFVNIGQGKIAALHAFTYCTLFYFHVFWILCCCYVIFWT